MLVMNKATAKTSHQSSQNHNSIILIFHLLSDISMSPRFISSTHIFLGDLILLFIPLPHRFHLPSDSRTSPSSSSSYTYSLPMLVLSKESICSVSSGNGTSEGIVLFCDVEGVIYQVPLRGPNGGSNSFCRN